MDPNQPPVPPTEQVVAPVVPEPVVEAPVQNPPNPSTTEPYKQKQFEEFIKTLKGTAIGHWVQIANALGVDRTTINEWRKLPLAQKAIEDGIEHAMDKMQEVGKDDWKMWESKLKMLNVSPVEKSDITTDGQAIPAPIYGNKSTE